MPAIITHHMFGTDVYGELAPIIGSADACREAFLLGNQGPDPLLFLRALPLGVFIRKIGGLMHAERPSELLLAFHGRFVDSRTGEAASVLKAYALGFLCHYLLDSAVHPLVFAQQRAYCDSGMEGLSRVHDWHGIHFLIEAELDEYVLASKLGVTVREFPPHREILRCTAEALKPISTAYADVARVMYRKKVPMPLFAASVELYRCVQLMLDGRRSHIAHRVDYARLAGPYFLTVDTLTHSGTLRVDTPFANHDHIPWPHHHNPGEIVNESFDDLFALAFSRALEFLPLFAQRNITLDDCRDITCGRNFSGKIVEP